MQQTSGDELKISVDASKMLTSGKGALSEMLLRLHLQRCSADVAECRTYFGGLTQVHATRQLWRSLAVDMKASEIRFVQPNTILEGKEVQLKQYEATREGIIQSWADRQV